MAVAEVPPQEAKVEGCGGAGVGVGAGGAGGGVAGSVDACEDWTGSLHVAMPEPPPLLLGEHVLKKEGGTCWLSVGVPEQSVKEYFVASAPPDLQVKVWLRIGPPLGVAPPADTQRSWNKCVSPTNEAHEESRYCSKTGPGPSELAAGGPVDEVTHSNRTDPGDSDDPALEKAPQ